MRAKEDEKVEKYQDLAREVRKMWRVRTMEISIVVGALGTTPLRLKENFRTIGVDTSIELIQRSVLLGSARILRKVIEMLAEEERKTKGRFFVSLDNWLLSGTNEN